MKNSPFVPVSEKSKPHRFVIYLPSCQADGAPIPGFEKKAEETARALCARFGGITSYPATGYFEGANRGAQKEAIQVLEFFCGPEELAREEAFLWSLLLKLRRRLNQESVACSLDGRMTLVTGEE